MKIHPRRELLVASLLLLVTLAIFRSASQVPFHPDETSILYQTRDLETWLSNPGSLTWSPDRTDEIGQTYRLLNPPLPKYLLGLAREIGGYGPEVVSVDWNWSDNWNENVDAGAYPSRDLLLTGRYASTTLMLLALLPLVLAAKRLGGNALAVFVLVLYLSNALILVHGRWLMAEGTLLFGLSLAIYGILDADKRPWLAGVGCALAVCSKLSATPLLLAGLIATLWSSGGKKYSTATNVRRGFSYLIIAAFIILLLNPVLWSNPLKGAGKIWGARVEFTERQIETLDQFAPGYVLETTDERLAGMISHLFIAPPQTYEVGNYLSETEGEITRYLSNPLHSIGRSWVGGVLAIGLFLLGILGEVINFKNQPWNQRREISLLAIATALQTIALFWANPIPFQRYYIPLVPFVILWTGMGMKGLIDLMRKTAARTQRPQQNVSSSYSRR